MKSNEIISELDLMKMNQFSFNRSKKLNENLVSLNHLNSIQKSIRLLQPHLITITLNLTELRYMYIYIYMYTYIVCTCTCTYTCTCTCTFLFSISLQTVEYFRK